MSFHCLKERLRTIQLVWPLWSFAQKQTSSMIIATLLVLAQAEWEEWSKEKVGNGKSERTVSCKCFELSA